MTSTRSWEPGSTYFVYLCPGPVLHRRTENWKGRKFIFRAKREKRFSFKPYHDELVIF
ncbi:hypothetical protein N665_0332s0050 [Sinapis alba]|nr:hypothetical protein N665_0332s0050 [Sinapis alba]